MTYARKRIMFDVLKVRREPKKKKGYKMKIELIIDNGDGTCDFKYVNIGSGSVRKMTIVSDDAIELDETAADCISNDF